MALLGQLRETGDIISIAPLWQHRQTRRVILRLFGWYVVVADRVSITILNSPAFIHF